jgi:hypothetical protein
MSKKIYYTVDSADWAIDYAEGLEAPKPLTTEIDDRTIRSVFFDTLEEAEKYAQDCLRNDDEWLAYLEIKKHIVETVKKLK